MTFSRHQLAQRTTLDAGDLEEVHRCRRAHNQLGFAYQVGFVRLLNRFPKQEPFEVLDELLLFTGVQLGVATNLIDEYQRRRQTISEHQQRITRYRGLRHFAAEERQRLVTFVFDAASRLEQTSSLHKRAEAFLAEQLILRPSEATIARLVGEQRQRARDRIVDRVVEDVSRAMASRLDTLLVVGDGEAAQLAHLQRWLATHMRQVRLPDLLIEVDNDLEFTRPFLPPSRQPDPAPDEICVLLAAVMAHGCNIGPYTMAQLTSDVTSEQLKRIGDWQRTRDTPRGALGVVVKALAGLDASLSWGEGKTSASDGQRYSRQRKVLQKTYSPRFSDFALEFYSFVADNDAPFFSTPIECTDRDAATVLDGLLYNESDLELEEHYTDTHGYPDINFAAVALLGRRFSPRMRGVGPK